MLVGGGGGGGRGKSPSECICPLPLRQRDGGFVEISYMKSSPSNIYSSSTVKISIPR